MPELAPQTNAAPLKLSPPREPLPPTFWESRGWEMAALLAVIVFCAIALKRMKAHEKTGPAVPPVVRARRELEALRGRPADTALAVETSRIIRRLAVDQFELAPDEPTTAELSGALKKQEDVPPDLADLIADFLRRCDAIKFSPATASPADLVTEAFQIVEHVEALSSVEPPAISPHEPAV